MSMVCVLNLAVLLFSGILANRYGAQSPQISIIRSHSLFATDLWVYLASLINVIWACMFCTDREKYDQIMLTGTFSYKIYSYLKYCHCMYCYLSEDACVILFC